MAKDNKTLHLVLKRKWWDMIASGEKKEEYRTLITIGRYACLIDNIVGIRKTLTIQMIS